MGDDSFKEFCLADGRAEIDKEQVETTIRPSKLGARNWLFIGREDAGTNKAKITAQIGGAASVLFDRLTKVRKTHDSGDATLRNGHHKDDILGPWVVHPHRFTNRLRALRPCGDVANLYVVIPARGGRSIKNGPRIRREVERLRPDLPADAMRTQIIPKQLPAFLFPAMVLRLIA